MTYNRRRGISAKKVFISVTDITRDLAGSASLTYADLTGNKMEQFWGAYYGDLTLNSVAYAIKDLGFDGTAANVSQDFDSQAYDTVSALTSDGSSVVTLTTNTDMTLDEWIGKYVTVKAASGKVYFFRITDNAAATLTLSPDCEDFITAADTIALLKIPFGLTMDAWQRLDHIATDFTLEPPKTETDTLYTLGTEDTSGAQNQTIDNQPLTALTGELTVRGMMQDLLAIKYGKAATAPTTMTRYNLGSESSTSVSFAIAALTDISDPDSTSGVSRFIFCNDVTINNVDILDTVSADGKAEGKVNFEVAGSQCLVEVYDAISEDTNANA